MRIRQSTTSDGNKSVKKENVQQSWEERTTKHEIKGKNERRKYTRQQWLPGGSAYEAASSISLSADD